MHILDCRYFQTLIFHKLV